MKLHMWGLKELNAEKYNNKKINFSSENFESHDNKIKEEHDSKQWLCPLSLETADLKIKNENYIFDGYPQSNLIKEEPLHKPKSEKCATKNEKVPFIKKSEDDFVPNDSLHDCATDIMGRYPSTTAIKMNWTIEETQKPNSLERSLKPFKKRVTAQLGRTLPFSYVPQNDERSVLSRETENMEVDYPSHTYEGIQNIYNCDNNFRSIDGYAYSEIPYNRSQSCLESIDRSQNDYASSQIQEYILCSNYLNDDNSCSSIEKFPEDYFTQPLDLRTRKTTSCENSLKNLHISEDRGYQQFLPAEYDVFEKDEVIQLSEAENNWLRKIRTGTRSRVRSPKSWEFLLRLLLDPESNPSMIRWEDHNQGTFRLVQKDEIARIWGMRSNKHKKGGVTYDNFARNLRYHYKSEIMVPVSEKHLVYKFGDKIMEKIRHGEQTFE